MMVAYFQGFCCDIRYRDRHLIIGRFFPRSTNPCTCMVLFFSSVMHSLFHYCAQFLVSFTTTMMKVPFAKPGRRDTFPERATLINPAQCLDWSLNLLVLPGDPMQRLQPRKLLSFLQGSFSSEMNQQNETALALVWGQLSGQRGWELSPAGPQSPAN